MTTYENDPYRYSSINGVDYTRLQEIFDEMFNFGYVCTKENMVQYIHDNNALPVLSREQVKECVDTFIDDTYNG